jgi:hypothetical protein
VGEQERGKVVEREGVLESIGGDAPVGPVTANVVDQYVKARVAVPDLAGEASHLRLL